MPHNGQCTGFFVSLAPYACSDNNESNIKPYIREKKTHLITPTRCCKCAPHASPRIPYHEPTAACCAVAHLKRVHACMHGSPTGCFSTYWVPNGCPTPTPPPTRMRLHAGGSGWLRCRFKTCVLRGGGWRGGGRLLPLEASFSSLGFATFPLIDPSLDV